MSKNTKHEHLTMLQTMLTLKKRGLVNENPILNELEIIIKKELEENKQEKLDNLEFLLSYIHNCDKKFKNIIANFGINIIYESLMPNLAINDQITIEKIELYENTIIELMKHLEVGYNGFPQFWLPDNYKHEAGKFLFGQDFIEKIINECYFKYNKVAKQKGLRPIYRNSWLPNETNNDIIDREIEQKKINKENSINADELYPIESVYKNTTGDIGDFTILAEDKNSEKYYIRTQNNGYRSVLASELSCLISPTHFAKEYLLSNKLSVSKEVKNSSPIEISKYHNNLKNLKVTCHKGAGTIDVVLAFIAESDQNNENLLYIKNENEILWVKIDYDKCLFRTEGKHSLNFCVAKNLLKNSVETNNQTSTLKQYDCEFYSTITKIISIPNEIYEKLYDKYYIYDSKTTNFIKEIKNWKIQALLQIINSDKENRELPKEINFEEIENEIITYCKNNLNYSDTELNKIKQQIDNNFLFLKDTDLQNHFINYYQVLIEKNNHDIYNQLGLLLDNYKDKQSFKDFVEDFKEDFKNENKLNNIKKLIIQQANGIGFNLGIGGSRYKIGKIYGCNRDNIEVPKRIKEVLDIINSKTTNQEKLKAIQAIKTESSDYKNTVLVFFGRTQESTNKLIQNFSL